MKTYTVIPHRIACMLSVTDETGAGFECMHADTGRVEARPFTASINAYSPDQFAALPLEVRAAVNRYFGEVFSLPNDGTRGRWVDAQVPFTVEVKP